MQKFFAYKWTGYALFFFLGLGLALVSSSVLAVNISQNPVATTLQGAYDLLTGKLDYIIRQNNQLLNTCAKR